MTTPNQLQLERGTTIFGKWQKQKYVVERLLGEGANGQVYLVHHKREQYALKIGFDVVDLQAEANVLRMIAKQQPELYIQLLDVDDVQLPTGESHPFYIMRFVEGVTVTQFLQQQSVDWFPLIGLHLLEKLSKLHQIGWIFGDVKADNILVSKYGKAELVDYGGATEFGKSVRQFTEIYDRGYWNAGSRSADFKYDLFSFAVLAVQLLEPEKLNAITKQSLPQNRSISNLLDIAENNGQLKQVAPWLHKALHGQFVHSEESLALWRSLLRQHHRKKVAVNRLPLWLKGLAAISGAMLAGATFIWFIGL
ncbi:phosphotransferase [Paenibacillus yanchengensis]|uniref:Phosphotransferase n=1 Tax=Paenibacillus yanchengensis TaxID=2035833 RepID=A0ABW4YIE4_9BACL